LISEGFSDEQVEIDSMKIGVEMAQLIRLGVLGLTISNNGSRKTFIYLFSSVTSRMLNMQYHKLFGIMPPKLEFYTFANVMKYYLKGILVIDSFILIQFLLIQK